MTPVRSLAPDASYEARVRDSFARMTLMRTIGARLVRVAPGEIDVELPFRSDLTQQHGFVSAGIITAIADTACGFAAMTLMPADAGVLTVEYKVNFMSPASGERFAARAHVIKAGRTLTVCAAAVFTLIDGEEKPVAAMLTTMIAVQDRAEVATEAR